MVPKLHMFVGLGKLIEGDFADTCARTIPLRVFISDFQVGGGEWSPPLRLGGHKGG